jgi:hypothetical protein
VKIADGDQIPSPLSSALSGLKHRPAHPRSSIEPSEKAFGPHNAPRLVHLRGLKEAILANDLVTEDRREFLLRRLEYWKSWVESPQIVPDRMTESEPFYTE